MISIWSRIRIIITFIFVNIVGVCFLNDQFHLANSKDVTCEDNIHAVMGKYYRGYKIITLESLEDDLKEYFKQNFANENPGCVSADFDGDGTIDYAVLLLREEQKMATEKVIVLKGQQNGKFIPINLYTIHERIHDFFLQKITPGKIKTESLW